MEIITLYKSTDGSTYPMMADAINADVLDAEVREIEATIPPKPRESSHRIAWSPDEMLTAKTKVVALCRREYPDEKGFKHDPADIHPMSYAGRFLSDATNCPLYRVWRNFMCYRDGWLYDQPFFALNPGEFEKQK